MALGLINSMRKKPLSPPPVLPEGCALANPKSARGLPLRISGQAFYASVQEGEWRYWIRRVDDDNDGEETFAEAVGRLLPMRAKVFFERLNDHATGAVRPSFFAKPQGEAFAYDLEEKAVAERFALACTIGEALSEANKVLSIRVGGDERRVEAAKALQDALPHLNTNLSLWALEAPSQTMVFLPNGVLLRRNRYQWVVPFGEIAVRYETLTHTADESTPSDVGICEADHSVTSGEIKIALSDQRVILQVSNPTLAKRVVSALEHLIATAPRQRAPIDPAKFKERAPDARRRTSPAAGRRASPAAGSSGGRGRQPRSERPQRGRRGRASSVGQIVIRKRGEGGVDDGFQISVASKEREAPAARPTEAAPTGEADAANEGLVIRVRVGPDAGPPPPPEPEVGVPTPEDMVCEASGLVFADECPMSADPDPLAPEPATNEAPMLLSEAAPPPPAPPPELETRSADAIRSAVGALMAYVAKSDSGFTEPERAVIREALQLPRAFSLDQRFSAIGPNSPALKRALNTLCDLDEELRRRVHAECERVAHADGQVTSDERTRLAELARGLGV